MGSPPVPQTQASLIAIWISGSSTLVVRGVKESRDCAGRLIQALMDSWELSRDPLVSNHRATFEHAAYLDPPRGADSTTVTGKLWSLPYPPECWRRLSV